jgi:hypothetical protein
MTEHTDKINKQREVIAKEKLRTPYKVMVGNERR